jgi:hypothetical protein
MRMVSTITRWIHGSPRWLFLAVIMVIALLKCGVWVVPNIGLSAELSTNPFAYHPGLAYLTENWLMAFLGWIFHLTSWQALTVLNAVESLAFVTVIFALLFRRLPERAARNASLVFVALPVSTTAFYWLGLDSLTLLLMGLAMLASRRWWLVLPIGVLLGLQHFEQGLAASLALCGVVGLGALIRVKRWRELVFPVALLLGVLIGKGVLTWILAVTHSKIDYDRFSWFTDNALGLLHSYLSEPLLLVYSVLGVGWFAVIKFATRGRRAIPLLAGLLVVSLLICLYADHTRVACIVALPIIVHELLLDRELTENATDTEVAWFSLLWVVVPWIWDWGNVVQPNLVLHDIEWALNRLFGWFHVPHGLDLPGWPWTKPVTVGHG